MRLFSRFRAAGRREGGVPSASSARPKPASSAPQIAALPPPGFKGRASLLALSYRPLALPSAGGTLPTLLAWVAQRSVTASLYPRSTDPGNARHPAEAGEENGENSGVTPSRVTPIFPRGRAASKPANSNGGRNTPPISVPIWTGERKAAGRVPHGPSPALSALSRSLHELPRW